MMRRFGSRWRDATTPREVLDIFLSEGRYEILIRNHRIDDPKVEWADGIDVDPEGYRHPSFELQPHEARAYRDRMHRKRQVWASLPAPVKRMIESWIKEE